PLVTLSRPARQCMSVDLPEPDGPMITVKAPRPNSAVTSSRATTRVLSAPKIFVTDSARTAAVVVEGGLVAVTAATLPRWRALLIRNSNGADPDTVPEMLVTSRAYDEYVAMFDLADRDLARSIVDVAAGSSGFAARWSQRGGRVISVDPAYAAGRAELAELGRDDLQRGSEIAERFPDRFVWDWFGDPQRRQALRSRALAEFLTDLVRRPGGYLAAALPALPFRGGAFDLALSSHLLFTWADQLGLDWH